MSKTDKSPESQSQSTHIIELRILDKNGREANSKLINNYNTNESWQSRDNRFKKENTIELSHTWRVLKRRRKLILIVFTGTTILTGLSLLQRLINPIYEGSFTLLISDPITNNRYQTKGNKSLSRSTEGLFEELAINTHTHDIPTLIETMRSSLLLEPIASKFGLKQADLSKRIKITTGGVNRQEAEGILKVVIRGKNTKKDQELLTDVSQVYLDTVLLQRQKA